MSKSECFCKKYSCEPLLDDAQTQDEKGETVITHPVSTTRRFRFIKDEDGVIVDGGVVSGDIPTCRASGQYEYSKTNTIKKSQEKDEIIIRAPKKGKELGRRHHRHK